MTEFSAVEKIATLEREIENLALNVAALSEDRNVARKQLEACIEVCIEARDYYAERLGARMREISALRRALEKIVAALKNRDRELPNPKELIALGETALATNGEPQ